jgi:CheY-like chemotaxis protein
MTIFVVSNSRSVRSAFGAIERSRTYTVEFVELDKANDALKRADAIPDSFVYLDADGMDSRTLKRRLHRLRDRRPFQFGIIDAKHSVRDIAELFHNHAADYVDKTLLSAGLTTARIRRVVEFEPSPAPRRANNHVPEHESHRLVPSGADWSAVQDGREYTFVMLYAAIDEAGDLQRKASDGFVSSLRKSFSALLERSFADYSARIWMWKEDEGILLMPFDGEQVDAIIPALRLMLNRTLINVEEFPQYGEISWRLALHLGNTTYRSSGRTGAIVSESVNFLFHLGSRFVEPAGLAVTGPAQSLVPEGIRPLLNHRGEFESIHIYTLRDLL